MSLLIGVGGTGQHIAAAVSRLAYIGAMEPLRICIVDADDQSAMAKSLRYFGRNDGNDKNPYLDDFSAPLPQRGSDGLTFEKLMVPTGAPDGSKELFEAFFDSKSASVAVHDGMFGNPAVGATVFLKAAYARDQQEQTVLGALLTRAQAAEGKVFVGGSFVGGTGAGVIHQLLAALRGKLKSPERIFLVALLPWLRLPGADDNAPVSESSQWINMQYGTDFLAKNSLGNVKSSCLLGIPLAEAGLAPAVAAPNNGESPHFLHAAAAYYLEVGSKRVVTTVEPEEVLSLLHGPDGKIRLLQANWRHDRSLAWWFQRAQWTKGILGFLLQPAARKEFAGSFGWTSLTPKGKYNAALYQAIKANVGKADDAANVAAKVLAALDTEVERLSYALDWGKAVFDNLPQSPVLSAMLSSDTEKGKALQAGCPNPIAPGVAGMPRPPAEIAAAFAEQVANSFSGGN